VAVFLLFCVVKGRVSRQTAALAAGAVVDQETL